MKGKPYSLDPWDDRGREVLPWEEMPRLQPTELRERGTEQLCVPRSQITQEPKEDEFQDRVHIQGKKKKRIPDMTWCFKSDPPSRTPGFGPSPPSPHAADPAARAGTPGRRAGHCLGTGSRTWKQRSER